MEAGKMAAPFFVTAATTKQITGMKRGIDQVTGMEAMRARLEELEATKKNQFIPLAVRICQSSVHCQWKV